MILKSIHLRPFAGVQDRVIQFKEGLTVILGPNEAGKSATVNALSSVLYANTKMTKTVLNKFKEQYFPFHGGTYAEVSLKFEHQQNDCTLSKRWSASPQFHFQYEAHRLDEELKWEEFIKKHFFPEATTKNILIISQMKLSATLELLKSEKQSLTSLGEVIRKAVLSTEGISVDVLQKNIDDKYNSYYSRWDITGGKPENGRDIDNPWKNAVGIVLGAYYEKRRKEVELKSAQGYELEYDRWNRLHYEAQNNFAALETWCSNLAEVYDGAKKRESKSELVKRIEFELQEYATIQKDWPRSEARLEMIRDSETANLDKLQHAENELKEADAYAKLKQSAEKFSKVEALKKELTEKQGTFAILQVIKKEDVTALDKLERDVAVNQGKLEAQKLNVRITALNDTEFSSGWTKDTLEAKLLQKDELSNAEYNGSFAFRTNDVFVEVFSGKVEVETLLASIKENEAKMKEVLNSYQVDSKDALAAKLAEYTERQSELRTMETKFNTTLGADDYEALKNAASALSQKQAPRSNDIIRQELSSLQKENGSFAAEIKSLERSLKQWQEKYTSLDMLNDSIGDKKGELKEIKKELESYPPLPQDFADAAAFVKEYENKLKAKDSALKSLNELKIEHASLEARKPESSVEDLSAELLDAEASYNRVQKDAEALSLIRDELRNLRAQLDSNTFAPLQKSISNYVSQLTLNKYTVPLLDDYLPATIQSADGDMSVQLLSAGTLDALALAVRLAMAEELLASRQAFVIMDDPLINLDPARKKASADTIRRFAEAGRQVVVFTFEPAHAALFGVDVEKLG